MGTHDLPDMYALGPWALGIHIRQITRAHVTTITCTILREQIKGPIQLKCIPGKRDTTEMYPEKVMHMIGG